MAKLICFGNASLNGYINDDRGKFDFSEPDEEVHQFVNDTLRNVGTHLYGRRNYETMMVWETDPDLANYSPITRDFAQIWAGADKVVYSTTLPAVQTKKTRLERHFDAEAVSKMLASSTRDILIAGPTLASPAFRAGLVDEVHVMLVPIIVPAGTRFLPDDVRLELQLISESRFTNGTVYLRYRAKR